MLIILSKKLWPLNMRLRLGRVAGSNTHEGLSSPACRSRRSQTVSIQEWCMALSRLGCRRPDKKAASSSGGRDRTNGVGETEMLVRGVLEGVETANIALKAIFCGLDPVHKISTPAAYRFLSRLFRFTRESIRARSSAMGTRSWDMVSRSRTVTQWSSRD